MATNNPLLNVVFKGGRPNRYARIDDEGNLEVCNISTGSTGPWMSGGSMVNNLRIQGNVVNTASATGNGAIALGANTNASGNNSIAEGVGAIASGFNGAIAIGLSSQATSGSTLAIGVNATASAGNAMAIGPHTSASAVFAITLGNGVGNSVANSIVFGANAIEQFRLLDAATGNFSNLVVQTNNAAAATTTPLTAAQALGGAFNITTTGAFNLPMPKGGDLDANAQLAGNLYVGMSFKCVITDTGAGALTLANSGDASTVVIGTLASAAGAARIVTFVRTGAGTWNAIAV